MKAWKLLAVITILLLNLFLISGCLEDKPVEPDSQPEPDPEPEQCIEDWECTDWSEWEEGECQPGGIEVGTRTRTCTEKNNCGTEDEKPSELETQYLNCVPTL